MNFLAHFLIALRTLPSSASLPDYTVGTALPDLLPLAARRVRLRPERINLVGDPETAMGAGVRVHLATDAAFHKTAAFAEAQAQAKRRLTEAGFAGMRVRGFFVGHVLTELALDAALLRATPSLGEEFYAAFSAADFAAAARWTEAVTQRALPLLPAVLDRFARSRYLLSYAGNTGVAEGLSRLCGQAGQDTFEGANFERLVRVVEQIIIDLDASRLLEETAFALEGLFDD